MTTSSEAAWWAEDSPATQQYRSSAGTTTSTFVTGELEDSPTPAWDWPATKKKNTSIYTFLLRILSENPDESLGRSPESLEAYKRALLSQSPVKVLVAEDETKSPFDNRVDWKFPASIDEDVLTLLKKVITEHFEVESELRLVAIYLREKGSQAEFLLVEVNDDAIPTGCVEPFLFSASEELPWPIYIADVTVNEWARMQNGTINLPPGWSDKPLRKFNRADLLPQPRILEAA